MREHIDADAERLQLGDAFEHLCRDADLVQAERKGQPANAAACDKYGHGAPLREGRHRMTNVTGQLRNHLPAATGWGWTALARAANLRPCFRWGSPCSSFTTRPAPARSPRTSRSKRRVPITKPNGSISKTTSRTAPVIWRSIPRGACRPWRPTRAS